MFNPRALAPLLAIALLAPAPALAGPIEDAVAAKSRTADNAARDKFRNPTETLTFFEVAPGETIVEIWPGGGWYTEILAPMTAKGGGTYYAATNLRGMDQIEKMKAKDAALYGAAKIAPFPLTSAAVPGVPDGTADTVLTFRNVHNWMMGDKPFAEDAFKQMFAMLKPGGTLGVVEHRLPETRADADQKTTGYVKQSTVMKLAKDAGFEFVGESKVNANPKDTADHPKGVWTLPPVLRLGDTDKAKYQAIGESDRMTLKFRKPVK